MNDRPTDNENETDNEVADADASSDADAAGERPEDHAGDVPLSGLRADIEERRRQQERSTPAADDAFEEAQSEPMLDGEQVWEDLLDSQEEPAGPIAFGEDIADDAGDSASLDDAAGESSSLGADVGSTPSVQAEDAAVISDRVCHNCKHFGDPPELHCTHDGTTIHRVVDMHHFEVVNCPVVKNRSDLREE